MKRMLRFLTVAFALTMLAAYVVYSQRQQAQTVAPGSKSTGGSTIVLTTNGGKVRAHINVYTNSTSTNGAHSYGDVVASSSKSLSPVVKVRPDTVTAPTNLPRTSDWIAPSTSKSGRIFDSSSLTEAITGQNAEAEIRKALAATNTPPTKASP